ncbi:MAG: polysaccharide deacetylase family protein [Proteobacteria bacterium]|nr:polysaccharide deacetylase family protein [Pseudomonadota bacterium]
MYNVFSWGKWRPVIHRQPAGVRDVALTFDDGPHPETTPALLDLLHRHGATATFFFTGVRAAAYRDLVARTVEAGHAVYGHGWDHTNFEHAPEPEILDSMERAEAVLREFRPTPDTYLIRLPYNAGCTRARIHALTTRFHPDTYFASWAITTRDWMLAKKCDDLSVLEQRCAVVAAQIGKLRSLPGALILMHEAPFDAKGSLVPQIARFLLPKVLEALDRRGLKAGPIRIGKSSQMLDRFLCWHRSDAGRPVRMLQMPIGP